MERKEKYISIKEELCLINKLSDQLIKDGYNSENTTVVTVSSDYSSITGQIIRHNLSFDGEICDGFSLEVPYPTQTWDDVFIKDVNETISTKLPMIKGKKLLLVENGVIMGGNYSFLVLHLLKLLPETEIKTLTLFENEHSIFKSDYVGEYYDNNTEDLTFSWEKFNNNWV